MNWQVWHTAAQKLRVSGGLIIFVAVPAVHSMSVPTDSWLEVEIVLELSKSYMNSSLLAQWSMTLRKPLFTFLQKCILPLIPSSLFVVPRPGNCDSSCISSLIALCRSVTRELWFTPYALSWAWSLIIQAPSLMTANFCHVQDLFLLLVNTPLTPASHVRLLLLTSIVFLPPAMLHWYRCASLDYMS
jgi:hypothetical protein